MANSALSGVLQVDVVDSWSTWLQVGAAVFTSLALVIGASWAFFRFRRGRTFEPRCTIDMDCSLECVASKMVLTVGVRVMNCGDSNVKFTSDDKGRIEVYLKDAKEWSSVPSSRFVRWQEAERKIPYDIFASEGRRPEATELEPGQYMNRSCLFVMPENWAAAQVRCLLTLGKGKKQRNWFTTRIVLRSALDRSQRSRWSYNSLLAKWVNHDKSAT